jgi:hypothetical protein
MHSDEVLIRHKNLFLTSSWDSSVWNKIWKGEVVPVHVMKAYNGSKLIAPLIRNLGTTSEVVLWLKFTLELVFYYGKCLTQVGCRMWEDISLY